MSNPIFSSFGNNNLQIQSQPSLKDMINQVKNSPNPDATMQMLFSSHPKYQEVMQYIQHNGGDAKSAFYNMAAQRGVNPDVVLSRLR
jgi:hypothetical protein